MMERALKRGAGLLAAGALSGICQVAAAQQEVRIRGDDGELSVPGVDSGGGLATPSGAALGRLASQVPGGALTREVLGDALGEIEEMLEDAERVTLTGVAGLDAILGETFSGPGGRGSGSRGSRRWGSGSRC